MSRITPAHFSVPSHRRNLRFNGGTEMTNPHFFSPDNTNNRKTVMNIQKTWFTAALSAGLLLPALALSGERVETFDFSRAGDGVIGGRNPAVIRTLSPYGRFRGSSALTIPGKTYPANALDRNGEWKALRFGSAKEYFTIPGFHLEPGKPFTIETWMRIYSQKPPLDGFLMDAGFGYKTGFRLVAVRSKRWAQEGWINLICGDGKTSRMLLGKNGSVNTWHHVVITTAGNAPALYIDGIPARSERPELSPLQFHFAKNTPRNQTAGFAPLSLLRSRRKPVCPCG